MSVSMLKADRLFPRRTAGWRGALLCLIAAAAAVAAPVQAQTENYLPYKAFWDYSRTTGMPPFTYTTSYQFQYGGILENDRVAALYVAGPWNERGVAVVAPIWGRTDSPMGRADCLLSASNMGFWTITSDYGYIDPYYVGGRSFAVTSYPETPITGLYWSQMGSSTAQAALLNGKNEEVPYVNRFFTMNILAASARKSYAAVKTLIRYEDFSNDNPNFNTAGDHNYIAVRRFNAADPAGDQEVFGAYHPDNLKSQGGTKTARGATTQAQSVYQNATMRIDSIDDISVGDNGEIAFAGNATRLTGNSAAYMHKGIFLWTGGDPYTCPGASESPYEPTNYATVQGLSTDGSKVAFLSGENDAIYVTDPFVTKATRTIGVGDVSNGYKFTEISGRLVYTGGRTLFGAKWQPASNLSATPRFGLFVFRDGKAQHVVSEGQAVDGGTLSKLTAWDMNANGKVVFGYIRATYSYGGPTFSRFVGAAYFAFGRRDPSLAPL